MQNLRTDEHGFIGPNRVGPKTVPQRKISEKKKAVVHGESDTRSVDGEEHSFQDMRHCCRGTVEEVVG